MVNNHQRYERQVNLKSFGKEAQQKLAEAKVLVVGAGGLGIPALQYLVSMGVGTIGIIDGDNISISNLNRQVLYSEAEEGQSKALVLSSKLAAQNPLINIIPYNTFLSRDNALELIADYDLIIDATDNFAARYLINDSCVITGKPFVYGAIQEFEGQLSVFNYKGGPTYRCLYPNAPTNNQIPDCNDAGVLGVVPGIIGCYQALEAVKIITGVGKPLSGTVKVFDFLNNGEYSIKLKTVEVNKQITDLQENYGSDTCTIIDTIDVHTLLQWLEERRDLQLVDVRDVKEYNNEHLAKALSKPLTSLIKEVDNSSDTIVTICQKGDRSLKAAEVIQHNNKQAKVFSVEGGIDKWKDVFGDKLIVHD